MTRYSIRIMALFFVCLTLTVTAAWAVDKPATGINDPIDPIMGIVVMSGPKVHPIGTIQQYVIMVAIQKSFHINALVPPLDWLTPTKLTFEAGSGVRVVETAWPDPHPIKFPFANEPLPVYDKMISVKVAIQADSDVLQGVIHLSGELAYQACTGNACLAPTKKNFVIDVNIGPAVSSSVGSSSVSIDDTAQAKSLPASPVTSTGPLTATENEPAEDGWLWLLLTTFLGGMLLNLTPCCYPLIPITMAYFGGQSSGRAGLAAHGLAYLIGIMVTYTTLGTFAALTGSMLGSALQHPATLISVAVVLVILALSMLGVYEFKLPGFITKVGQTESGRRGVFGSLIMGLTLGIVAAPCLGPLTLGVLTLVAKSGDPLTGALIFGSLSLGLGLPLATMGLISNWIKDRLPASGAWMEWVRRILGSILVIMAIYLLRPLMPDDVWHQIIGGAAIGAAGLAWWAVKGVNRRIKIVATAIWLVIGLVMIASAPINYTHYPLYTPDRLAQAKGQPVVLDFYAEWCAPCRELAENMADPDVAVLLQKAVVLTVDLTDWESKEAEKLRLQYRISGVPTLAFIDRDGHEIPKLRLIGAVKSEIIIETMEEFLASQKQ